MCRSTRALPRSAPSVRGVAVGTERTFAALRGTPLAANQTESQEPGDKETGAHRLGNAADLLLPARRSDIASRRQQSLTGHAIDGVTEPRTGADDGATVRQIAAVVG